VHKLRCADVEWRREGGRMAPVEVSGSEFEVDADLVLLSMGFVGPGRNLLVEELGLQLDERGFVRRFANGMTSGDAIFVAGDMTQGASLVVRAIADGQNVARGVLAFLRGRA
jgi:glutamate synthase (NADPH) small chain